MRSRLRRNAPHHPRAGAAEALDCAAARWPRRRERTIAQHRQSDAAKLIGLIRGDLDWIVMKALEKDRTRRYETANGLAIDIQRHLANEPVLARPTSGLYRFRRLVRRNKVSVAAAAAIAATLVAATIISAWQAIRATRERDAKDLARQEAEAIAGFLTEVFQSPDPQRSGRTITVAETLDRAVRKLDDLDGHPERRLRLQATLGWTYHTLGLDREAIPLLEKVRDHCLATFGRESHETMRAIGNLALAYHDVQRRDEALQMWEEVLRFQRRKSGPKHADTIIAMSNLARCYEEAKRHEEALPMQEEVLAFHRQVSGPEHRNTLASLHALAGSYSGTGRWKEALKLIEEVLSLSRKVNGPEHPDTLHAMSNLAIFYLFAGRTKEALQLREDALPLYRKVLGPEHQGTLWAASNLASSWVKEGRLEGALKLREETAALYAKALGPDNPTTRWSRSNLAESYLLAGRVEEALALWEAVALGVPAAEYRENMRTLPLLVAALQVWFGRNEDHAVFCRRILERDHATDSADVATVVARTCLLRPMTDIPLLDKALTLTRRSVALGQGSKHLCWYHLTHGMAEYRRGNYKAADEAMLAAERQCAVKDAWRPEVVAGTAQAFRAMSLFQQGDRDGARKLLATVEAEMAPPPADDRQPLAGDADHDDLVLWLAWREAKALFEKEAPAGPAKPDGK